MVKLFDCANGMSFSTAPMELGRLGDPIGDRYTKLAVRLEYVE
jgi:hypothetical protein